jgi:hypothetical protein
LKSDTNVDYATIYAPVVASPVKATKPSIAGSAENILQDTD